jgi:plastocyanin
MARNLWLVLHVGAVLFFLGTHGASMAASFRLRKERDPQRVADLIQFSGSTSRMLYVSMGLVVATGVGAAFVGHWWSAGGWIWAALGTLLVTSLLMYWLAKPYYRRVAFIARAKAGGSHAVTDEQFDRVLRSGRPLEIAALGSVALLFILYLMVYKPSLGIRAATAPPPAAACSPHGATLKIAAIPSLRFDTSCLAVAPGTPFTIGFDNRDTGVPHNVDVFRDAGFSLHVGGAAGPGDFITGPASATYHLAALPAGTYFFRCDLHPAQMTGRLIVR